MPTIIPVKFTYAARDLWFDPAGTGAQEADHVICSTERGTEIGLATGDAREVSEEELEHVIGHAQLRSVVRIATDSDLDRAEQLAARGEDAMPTFRRLVGASGLDMKPVGVEYLFDGEKAVCYFAAEERVDFRQLVRDLSRELHVRIDMRQIGVREEAAIVGGYGHCGQELCCRRFNMSFDPVSIRMAKEQDLPLNSTKISGACGRLMCCGRLPFSPDWLPRAPLALPEALPPSSERRRLRRVLTKMSAASTVCSGATPFLRSSSARAIWTSGESRRSRTSRVTVSGLQAQPSSLDFLQAASEAVMSARATRICLPLSRRRQICSLGVSYSMILPLPKGVSMTALRLGARPLKSR